MMTANNTTRISYIRFMHRRIEALANERDELKAENAQLHLMIEGGARMLDTETELRNAAWMELCELRGELAAARVRRQMAEQERDAAIRALGLYDEDDEVFAAAVERVWQAIGSGAGQVDAES